MAGGLALVAVAGAAWADHLESDRDDDGIPDCHERTGFRLEGTSTLLRTDPDTSDTDGDGVPDGSELSRSAPNGSRFRVRDVVSCRVHTYPAWSDPTRSDTDEDGLDDAVELSEGSDPYAADGDQDGLADAAEREWGADPHGADTDGDGRADGEDIDDGLSPVVVDMPIDDEAWHLEYAKGISLGEFDEIDSVPQLLGALSGGMSGSVPIIGWVMSTLGDVRDAIAGIVDDDWAAVLTSVAAILPFAGDSAKAGKQIARFVERNPDQLRRLVQGILALEHVPDPVRAALLRAADREGFDTLRDFDMSDEAIIALARRGTILFTVVAAVDGAAGVLRRLPADADSDGFVEGLPEAQAALREYAGGLDDTDDVTAAVYVDTAPAQGQVGGRLVDACTACTPSPEPGRSTLRMAKVGSLHHSRAVQSQIDKDADLIDLGHRLEWHLFAGPTGWTVDAAVLEALTESGIPYFVHLPG